MPVSAESMLTAESYQDCALSEGLCAYASNSIMVTPHSKDSYLIGAKLRPSYSKANGKYDFWTSHMSRLDLFPPPLRQRCSARWILCLSIFSLSVILFYSVMYQPVGNSSSQPYPASGLAVIIPTFVLRNCYYSLIKLI